MILSLSDFLGDNIVVVVLILLGGILGTIGYLKRNVFAKYLPHDDIDQTPEEILQDELDSLLVTEKYNPVEKKTKEQELLDDDELSILKIIQSNRNGIHTFAGRKIGTWLDLQYCVRFWCYLLEWFLERLTDIPDYS